MGCQTTSGDTLLRYCPSILEKRPGRRSSRDMEAVYENPRTDNRYTTTVLHSTYRMLWHVHRRTETGLSTVSAKG
jgi:hypothetical protein